MDTTSRFAKRNEKAAEENRKWGFVPLVGGPGQVPWAESIRHDGAKHVMNRIEKARQEASKDPERKLKFYVAMKRGLGQYLARLAVIEDAQAIIDRKDEILPYGEGVQAKMLEVVRAYVQHGDLEPTLEDLLDLRRDTPQEGNPNE